MPNQKLFSLTATIAVLLMAEGVIRCYFAYANRDIKGWGWRMFSGMATIALSVMIVAGLPMDAFYVIGILVGVNLISGGIARIGVAWEGRKIANATN